MIISDCLFHAVLLQQSSGRERKKSKNCQNNVYIRIAYNSFCLCIFGHYICILLCVVTYVIVSVCVYADMCHMADLKLSPKYMYSGSSKTDSFGQIKKICV